MPQIILKCLVAGSCIEYYTVRENQKMIPKVLTHLNIF